MLVYIIRNRFNYLHDIVWFTLNLHNTPLEILLKSEKNVHVFVCTCICWLLLSNQNFKSPYIKAEVVEEVMRWLGKVGQQNSCPNWDAFPHASQLGLCNYYVHVLVCTYVHAGDCTCMCIYM